MGMDLDAHLARDLYMGMGKLLDSDLAKDPDE